MGLFKNGVGRPSNETLKKRRILLLVILFVFLIGAGVGVFYTINYFKNNTIAGTDKSIKSDILATNPTFASSTDMEDSMGYKYSKNTYADLKKGLTYYLIDMSSTATLKIKTSYTDSTVNGKTKNKKKYHYQVQVVSYAAGDLKTTATSKATIKSKTITQTLQIKNSISYITIFIYDASSSRKVVETKSFAILPKGVNNNLYKVFKDSTLSACVLNEYNTKFKVSKIDLTNAELAKITYLDCSRANTPGDVLDTTGLEKLTGLKTLSISGKFINSINLKKNTNLTELIIYDTSLKKIDLTKNTLLKKLSITESSLDSINLTKNTNLTKLNLSANNLSSINLTKNTKLTELNLSYNALTEINVKKNTKLTSLEVNNNKLTALDLSKNTNLRYLIIRENKIKSLDVSKNTKLLEVCSDLPDSKINVGSNKNVTLSD